MKMTMPSNAVLESTAFTKIAQHFSAGTDGVNNYKSRQGRQNICAFNEMVNVTTKLSIHLPETCLVE
jgi:hypothetical protein